MPNNLDELMQRQAIEAERLSQNDLVQQQAQMIPSIYDEIARRVSPGNLGNSPGRPTSLLTRMYKKGMK